MDQKNQSTSPILLKYLEAFEKNPTSKVFAPLAEAYRKLGMIDEAYKVLKKGIKNHPTYVLGYTALAHCYFDQGKFDLAYNTIRPLVSGNLDNVSLQKLFAQTCQKLEFLDEALETYKYLLFINPKDKNIAFEVSQIEDKLQICLTDTVGPKPFESFFENERTENFQTQKLQNISPGPTSDDDWVEVNFSAKNAPQESAEEREKENVSTWTMNQGSNDVLKDYPTKDKAESDQDLILVKETPKISFTLVDLYYAQGYFDKAQEILEKFLEMNPHDEAIRARLAEVKNAPKSLKVKDKPRGEGHEDLMHTFDQTISHKKQQFQRLKGKLESFLEGIKKRHQQLPFYIEAES